ncbi:carbohydrate phosphatase, partial [Imleria badia]
LCQTGLRSILTLTVNLARLAGTIILEDSQAIQSFSFIDENNNSADLVTEYDVAVENLVMTKIKNAYPSFQRSWTISRPFASRCHVRLALGRLQRLRDDPTFCVHPIDGLTNVVHGFPFCCISLGLIYQKCIVLGVVYNPSLDYLFDAPAVHKGGRPGIVPHTRHRSTSLAPPRIPETPPFLSKAQIGSDRGTPFIHDKAGSSLRLAGGKLPQSLGLMSSAGFNFSMVAQGALDLYW